MKDPYWLVHVCSPESNTNKAEDETNNENPIKLNDDRFKEMEPILVQEQKKREEKMNLEENGAASGLSNINGKATFSLRFQIESFSRSKGKTS